MLDPVEDHQTGGQFAELRGRELLYALLAGVAVQPCHGKCWRGVLWWSLQVQRAAQLLLLPHLGRKPGHRRMLPLQSPGLEWQVPQAAQAVELDEQ